MKKKILISALVAALACVSVAGCSLPKKNSVDQGDMTVFPVSTYDDGLSIAMGDVMPFYDDGVMNIYHLKDDKNGIYYHPISRLTTTDFVNYVDEGVALNYESSPESVDAALGTGSFIKDKNGNYHCFYTGHHDDYQEAGLPYAEVVRHAVSVDGQKTWTKDEDFKLYGYENDFRDPYVYYDESDQLYYMLVTTRDYGCGVIKRYSSTSLNLEMSVSDWKDEGIFFKNDAGDYNMECPSYIEYNGFWYLAYSEQGDHRITHYRYKSEKDGEWKKFDCDSIDDEGFYAGRLEKAGNDLYAFAWCAKYEWGGNLVAHKIKQLPSGELCAVMIDNVKNTFSTQVRYKLISGELAQNLSFGGEGFKSLCLEKLARNVTRISFKISCNSLDGDFGLTFGLDGKYNDRLAQGVIAFDVKNNRLTCYNEVSSILRYGSPLASVNFNYEQNKDYDVGIIIDGDVLSVYLNDEVCLTGRLSNMQRKNFAFYSNGVKAEFKEIAFYE